MRQIIYISTATAATRPADAGAILEQSRRNNTGQDVTGLLYFDGKRFLQALEGEAATLEGALARIERDARHRAIVILSDRTIETREFGDWAMAYRAPGDDVQRFIDTVGTLVARASPHVRATFNSFAEVRRAA